MAYNEVLAGQIEKIMGELPQYEAKKMFGGVGYMIRGNMACGVHKDKLIVRVGPDKHEETLARPHTAVFDITGRPMIGWIMISREGYENEADLRSWIRQGIEFALSLPAK